MLINIIIYYGLKAKRGYMELSERKKKILQVVVDDYIADVEPISSKKVKDRHLSQLSSATIRSELAALEDMGYLGQPHTSSGRIPLPKAYRFYVDKLMERNELTEEEINYIKKSVTANLNHTETLVKEAAKVISDLTNYTAVGIKGGSNSEIIENIKLVKISDKTVLLVIVTKDRVLKDSVILLSENVGEQFIDSGAEMLKSIFCGKSIKEAVRVDGLACIDEQFNKYRNFFENVINALLNYINDSDLVVKGTDKMLEYPEFADVEKARKFLSIIDGKKSLLPLIKSGEKSEINLSITIGGEEEGDMKDFSLVTANFSVDGKDIGSAGVIGPVRMEYGKVVSVLECIRETLNTIIK